jgi:hypothetical protein
MTPEEERYYDNYFDLFSSDGWKQLVEEVKEIHSSYVLESLNSIEELYKAKGEREILSRILSFENGIEAAYASLKEGDSYIEEVVG